MNTFQTFPTNDPEPDKGVAVARIDGQDEYLDYLEGPLVTDAIERTNTQEDELKKVYRTLTNTAKSRVGVNVAMLDGVIDPLFTRLNTRLANQQAEIQRVLGTLPADVRARIVSPPDDDGPKFDTIPTPFDAKEEYESSAERVPIVPPIGGWPYEISSVPNPQFQPSSSSPIVTATTSPGTAVCPAPIVNVSVNCPAPIAPPKSQGKPEPKEEDAEDDDKCPKEKEPPPPSPPGTCPPDVSVLTQPLPDAPVCMTAPPKTPVLPAVFEKPWNTCDPALCQHADKLVTAFASVGDEIHTVLVAGINAAADFAGLLAKLKDVRIVGAMFGVLSPPGEVLERVMRQIDRVMTDHVKTFCGPRWKQLLGLYFTRGILTSMNSCKLGINFIITADITFSVMPQQVIDLVDYLVQYLFPMKLPDLAEVEGLYLSNLITLAEAHCLAAMHGRQDCEFDRNVLVKRTRLTMEEEMRFWLRRRYPREDVRKLIRSHGYLDPFTDQKIFENAQFLPPPSDAIRFSVRDVFDPNKLGIAEMRKEFEQQVGLREMLNAVGIGVTSITDENKKTWDLDLPWLYFMASYEECSPTQSYEMLHRLRPNRVARYALPNAGGGVTIPTPVSIETVRSLLKEKDYNPIWRDRLAAISFRVPGRIDIRNMYRRGTFGQPLGNRGVDRTDPANPKLKGVAEVELGERYQDQGYSPADAAILVSYDASEFDRIEGSASRATQLKRICRGYSLGTYTFDGAVQLATPVLGDRTKAIEFIGGCDLDFLHTQLAASIAAVKRQWLDGTISGEEARRLLLSYGVVPSRVDALTKSWLTIRIIKRRELSAQQIATFYVEGMLTRPEAMQRLGNLGFDNRSGNAILDHATAGQVAKSNKERERVIKAELREAERRERLRKGEAKEREAAQAKRLVRLLALRTDKNLKEWWGAGEITRQEVREALLARGADSKDVERWLTVNDPGRKGNDDGEPK